jgi:hypothetical protein
VTYSVHLKKTVPVKRGALLEIVLNSDLDCITPVRFDGGSWKLVIDDKHTAFYQIRFEQRVLPKPSGERVIASMVKS